MSRLSHDECLHDGQRNGTKFMIVFSKVLVLSFVLAAMGLLVPDQANANAEAEAVKEISNHFTTVPTMTGEFIQFGPNGEQTGGKFYIHRPGRIRFNYEDPSPIMVVSNGKTLAVNNKKLKTWSYYPLDKTPLSLLLSNEIKIEDKSVRSVETNEDVTRVVMGDKNIFGDSEITFGPGSQSDARHFIRIISYSWSYDLNFVIFILI